MKRKKPNFIRDWFDEYTRFEKWWARKIERIRWKREIKGEWKKIEEEKCQ